MADNVISDKEKENVSLKEQLALFNPCGHTGFESAPCDVCGYPDSRKLIAKLKENEEGIRRIFAQVLPETECDAHGIPSVEALAGNLVEKIAVLNDARQRLRETLVWIQGVAHNYSIKIHCCGDIAIAAEAILAKERFLVDKEFENKLNGEGDGG